MISKTGRKIFFINPPDSLKGSSLEYIFKNEFELYILENRAKLNKLLNFFHDAIVFINIDVGMTPYEWVDYIEELQRKHPNVIFTVFSGKDRNALKKTLLMDIGITGGYIQFSGDNWETVKLINQVLEINEARGRRKSVRLDFNKNELKENIISKIFTTKGYTTIGDIISFSSAGLFITITKGKLDKDDIIERVVFKLNDHEIDVNGYVLKTFDNGNIFITFKDISESDKEFVQMYIFNHLQESFKRLVEKIK